MPPFAGVVALDGDLSEPRFEAWAGQAAAGIRGGRVLARRAAGAMFVQWPAGAPGRQGGPPLVRSDGNILFAADARLDNRTELAEMLGMAPPQRAGAPDNELILQTHRRWGDAGIARCLGAFAFALWDSKARRLTLARDCLGARALYFCRARDTVAFATTLRALLALPGVPRAIDELVLANFLAVNLAADPRRTFYRGIERVPSRTLVTIDRAEIRHRTYWSPDFDAAPPYRRQEDYVERARELFDQAVATATSDTPHVAIAASGGLDSSAVAATVARLGRAERIFCAALVAPPGCEINVRSGRYRDERDKVEALGRMYPALEWRFLTDDVPHPFEGDDTRLFARTGIPVFGPSTFTLLNIGDAFAAAGHASMLSGMAGNFGLSWNGKFSLLSLLREGRWATFTRDLVTLARHDHDGLGRAIFREIVTHTGPKPVVRLVHRLRGRDPDSVARFSPLNPAFIAEYALARQWQTEGFSPSLTRLRYRTPARFRANLLFDDNQIARDLYAEGGGLWDVEVRDPHADRRLLEFALSVPETMYRRDGVPRSFARAVFADRLPPEIVHERRRGANAVSWFHRLNLRRPGIALELERLEASPLARRLIDLPRLKRLMTQWPKDANEAENRLFEFRMVLNNGVHVGRFIRWVEGGNA